MSNPPVIDFHSTTNPFPTITTETLTGTGFSSAVVVGTTSNVGTIRIYNNFAGAASISDATNCVLSSYDDTVHLGAATTPPVTQRWLYVEVVDYDGTTTGADTQYYPIGGSQKHAVPVNGGTLAGGAAHYITVNLKVVVPVSATASTVTQGLWLEYSWI